MLFFITVSFAYFSLIYHWIIRKKWIEKWIKSDKKVEVNASLFLIKKYFFRVWQTLYFDVICE